MLLTRRAVLAATAVMASGLPVRAEEATLDVLHCFPSFARFHEPLATAFMQKHPDIKIMVRAPAPMKQHPSNMAMSPPSMVPWRISVMAEPKPRAWSASLKMRTSGLRMFQRRDESTTRSPMTCDWSRP